MDIEKWTNENNIEGFENWEQILELGNYDAKIKGVRLKKNNKSGANTLAVDFVLLNRNDKANLTITIWQRDNLEKNQKSMFYGLIKHIKNLVDLKDIDMSKANEYETLQKLAKHVEELIDNEAILKLSETNGYRNVNIVSIKKNENDPFQK